jgi:hypothetical protein
MKISLGAFAASLTNEQLEQPVYSLNITKFRWKVNRRSRK